jgi:hypothetical protein
MAAGTASVLGVGLCLVSVTACAHPNRVSPRVLQRLANSGAFVLVFGSVSTPAGTLARPVVRFVRPADQSTPEYLLASLTISNGDRFYAVLQPPPPMPYVDSLYLEIGSVETGFDRISYSRLRPGSEPVAMYFGEILLSPAWNRTARGQTLVVKTGDDFQNAQRELKRLYPHFAGSIEKRLPVASRD